MTSSAQPGPGLSPRGQAVLRAVQDGIARRGYSPSYREIAAAAGLASVSSVAYHMSILQARGLLQRDAGRPRTTVIRLPDGPGRGDDSTPGAQPHAAGGETVRAPLLGRIAAGGPILADESVQGFFSLPAQLVGRGEFFLLRVAGESMINAGILDGDLVVVRPGTDAENGDIVAALVEDGETGETEATVKTFKRAGGHVWLLPHNPAHVPILGDKARIAGKVVAVLRRV